MPTLVLLQEGEAIPYGLDGEITVLGRAPECQIQLDSNMVSRRHAQVIREGNAFLCRGPRQRQWDVLNGKRIAGRTPLRSDDRLKLGPILLRFETGGPVTQTANAGRTGFECRDRRGRHGHDNRRIVRSFRRVSAAWKCGPRQSCGP